MEWMNRPAAGPGPRIKNVDTTFGIFRRQDGQMQMGSEIVKISEDGTILNVDGVEYDLTPGLHRLIVQKHPRTNQWTSGDYQAYKYLSIQTKVRSHTNPRGVARPRSTWKYKHMLRKMIVPGECIVEEESDDSEDSLAGESTIEAHRLSNRDYSLQVTPRSGTNWFMCWTHCLD